MHYDYAECVRPGLSSESVSRGVPISGEGGGGEVEYMVN